VQRLVSLVGAQIEGIRDDRGIAVVRRDDGQMILAPGQHARSPGLAKRFVGRPMTVAVKGPSRRPKWRRGALDPTFYGRVDKSCGRLACIQEKGGSEIAVGQQIGSRPSVLTPDFEVSMGFSMLSSLARRSRIRARRRSAGTWDMRWH